MDGTPRMGGPKYLVKLKSHPTILSVTLIDNINQSESKVGIDLEVFFWDSSSQYQHALQIG